VKTLFIYICILFMLMFAVNKIIPETPYNKNKDSKQVNQQVKQETKQDDRNFNQDAINVQIMFSGL
jgi:uncharacterized membrane protein